jgi:hypothetical protein
MVFGYASVAESMDFRSERPDLGSKRGEVREDLIVKRSGCDEVVVVRRDDQEAISEWHELKPRLVTIIRYNIRRLNNL